MRRLTTVSILLTLGCVEGADQPVDDDGRADALSLDWRYTDNGGGSYVAKGFTREGSLYAVATVLLAEKQVTVGLSVGSATWGATYLVDDEDGSYEWQIVNERTSAKSDAWRQALGDVVRKLALSVYYAEPGEFDREKGCVAADPARLPFLPVTCGEYETQENTALGVALAGIVVGGSAAILSIAVVDPILLMLAGSASLAPAVPALSSLGAAMAIDLDDHCRLQPAELTIEYCE